MIKSVLRVRSLIIGLGFAAAALLPSVGSADIVINEVMAKNENTLKTKYGTEGLDWVELYNDGDEEVDVRGWYLYNNPTKPTGEWTQIESGNADACKISAKGFLVVFCDGRQKAFAGRTRCDA